MLPSQPSKRQRSGVALDVDEESNPHKLDEKVREEKISIFLSGPEKPVCIFLSSYTHMVCNILEGCVLRCLIFCFFSVGSRTERNLTRTPRLISFFLAFVVRNGVLPELVYQRSLKRALGAIKWAGIVPASSPGFNACRSRMNFGMPFLSSLSWRLTRKAPPSANPRAKVHGGIQGVGRRRRVRSAGGPHNPCYTVAHAKHKSSLKQQSPSPRITVRLPSAPDAVLVADMSSAGHTSPHDPSEILVSPVFPVNCLCYIREGLQCLGPE